MKSIKEAWEELKNNEVYCHELMAWNSGGGIIITEMPIGEYNGMDAFMVLDDEDCLAIYINRMDEYGDAPFYDDYAIAFLNKDERLSEAVAEYAKQLMKAKCEYYKQWHHTNYKEWCENFYSGEVSYFDMFDNFQPREWEE